jgi:hypothetical protein
MLASRTVCEGVPAFGPFASSCFLADVGQQVRRLTDR